MVNGIVEGDNSISVGSLASLTATSCKIINGNTCLLDPWKII